MALVESVDAGFFLSALQSARPRRPMAQERRCVTWRARNAEVVASHPASATKCQNPYRSRGILLCV